MEDRPLEDKQLLQRFVKDHSQEAFAALSARYLNLVYAICRRELADAETAEDVTQAVFLILARKAPHLGRNVVLSGWLFQTARFAAKNVRFTAQRRAAYEQKAAEYLMEQHQSEDEHWTEIEPLLNQSLDALKTGERECVLLRFFQGASFAEVSTSLGLSEDAARKRVTRSLEKMRQFFTKNGVIVPALALPVLLTAHAAKAAPIGLAPAIAKSTSGVLAGHINVGQTSPHVYQTSKRIIKAMKIVQIKVVAGITAAAVIGLGSYAASRAVTQHQPTAVLINIPKPGHVLQQIPGKTLTAGQIAEHCRQAYAALQSYQCTATVIETATSPALTPSSMTNNYTASIQYEKPSKLHAEGLDDNKNPWAYTSDGAATEQMNNRQGWQTVGATQVGGTAVITPIERAISIGVVLSKSAGTTIPSMLLYSGEHAPDQDHPNHNILAELLNGHDTEVREDMVDGQLCYVLTGHLTLPTLTQTESVWIDEKTFMIHRVVTDTANPAQTAPLLPIALPQMRTHSDQRITNERLNQPIPASAFALPAMQ